jgi:hypothetical protein
VVGGGVPRSPAAPAPRHCGVMKSPSTRPGRVAPAG